MNTKEVKEALKLKYESNEWALLFEVRNFTGYSSSQQRYADAIAMNLWPSRGLSVLGFEIKVSRSDWLNELKKPEKADPIIKYCDYFYLVVGDKNIVKGGELPDNWGLMIPFGKNRLKIKKDAPKLDSKPLDRGFIASMMRQAMNQLTMENEIRKRVKEKIDERTKYLENIYINERQRLENEIDVMRKAIRDFSDATGVDIYKRYGYVDLESQIEVIKFLKFGNIGGMMERLRRLGIELSNIANKVNSLVTEQKFYNSKHKRLFPRP